MRAKKIEHILKGKNEDQILQSLIDLNLSIDEILHDSLKNKFKKGIEYALENKGIIYTYGFSENNIDLFKLAIELDSIKLLKYLFYYNFNASDTIALFQNVVKKGNKDMVKLFLENRYIPEKYLKSGIYHAKKCNNHHIAKLIKKYL